MKAILTTLKLALPAAAVLLLAGCITDPYQYRGGYGGQGYGGDYYYGRPSVEYRHRDYYGGYGGYGGYGYGYPYYGRSGWSFGVSYGYPYGYGRYGYGRYGYGYGGWPYYYHGYPSHPPIVVRPRPGTDHDHEPQPGSGGDNQGPAPWRDLARLRDLNPGPAILAEPQAPRIRQQYEERQEARPAPEVRMRAPRPMAEAPSRPTRASRVERVQRMVEERNDER